MVADRLCVAGHLQFNQRVFADSGYVGEKVTTASLIAVEIVSKNPDQGAQSARRSLSAALLSRRCNVNHR
jgi:hypothetical protein